MRIANLNIDPWKCFNLLWLNRVRIFDYQNCITETLLFAARSEIKALENKAKIRWENDLLQFCIKRKLHICPLRPILFLQVLDNTRAVDLGLLIDEAKA